MARFADRPECHAWVYLNCTEAAQYLALPELPDVYNALTAFLTGSRNPEISAPITPKVADKLSSFASPKMVTLQLLRRPTKVVPIFSTTGTKREVSFCSFVCFDGF